MMKQTFMKGRLAGALAALAAILAACTATAPPPPAEQSVTKPAAVPPTPAAKAEEPVTPVSKTRQSSAATSRAYRNDAATHLYGLNRDRIYKGRMPPLLYAIGVLQVDVDERGMVRNVSWMRAPKHAPEVMADIERMVRTAAPYPAPAKIGKVTYTDTWLWHKSGKFQLDTLTEGQD